MGTLSLKQKRFFFSVYGIALFLMLAYIWLDKPTLEVGQIQTLIFFILVMALSESITFYFRKMSFSTTFALTIATYMTLGPFISLLCFLGGFLLRVIKVNENTYKHLFNTPLYGTVFNCSMFIISFLISHLAVQGCSYLLGKEIWIIYIIVFSVVYFLVNKLILAALQSIYSKENIVKCFFNEFALVMISYFIMIPFGIVFATLYTSYSYWGVIIPLFPVLLIKYTFTLYAEANLQYVQTVETLMNAIDARDEYTQGHSKRVGELACLIGKAYGLKTQELEQLQIAAMLHDIGKIGIRDHILHKPGKLTDEEFTIIKSHPAIGEGIIKGISSLQNTRSIIRGHHERYDGKGYPDGKKGDELEIEVYIIQLADAIDAMASDRPYRKGLPPEVILEEVKKGRGKQFHPVVVDIYLRLLETNPQVKKIWG